MGMLFVGSLLLVSSTGVAEPAEQSRLRALALISVDTFARTNLTAATIDTASGKTTLPVQPNFHAFPGDGSVDAACGTAFDGARGAFVVPTESSLAVVDQASGAILGTTAVVIGQDVSSTAVDARAGRFLYAVPGDGFYAVENAASAVGSVTATARRFAPLRAGEPGIRCVAGVDTKRRRWWSATLATSSPNVTLALTVVDTASDPPTVLVTHALDVSQLGGLEALVYDAGTDTMLMVTARSLRGGWRVSSLDHDTGAVTTLVPEFSVANHAMWFHGGCGYTAANGTLYAILATAPGFTRRALIAIEYGAANASHPTPIPLDTSFAPAAAEGYQGPEWAALHAV